LETIKKLSYLWPKEKLVSVETINENLVYIFKLSSAIAVVQNKKIFKPVVGPKKASLKNYIIMTD